MCRTSAVGIYLQVAPKTVCLLWLSLCMAVGTKNAFQLVARLQAQVCEQVGLHWHFYIKNRRGRVLGFPDGTGGNCCSSWKTWVLHKTAEKSSLLIFFSPRFCFFDSYSIIESVISITFFEQPRITFRKRLQRMKCKCSWHYADITVLNQ